MAFSNWKKVLISAYFKMEKTMKNINNQSQALDKIAGLEDLNHENAAVCSGGRIDLFDGAGLTGANVSFIAFVTDLRSYAFNDKASSIRITSGESWQLFENVNYQGASGIFGSGTFNLPANLNNIVSSAKRVK
jgi:Beta/Gamma crystallin